MSRKANVVRELQDKNILLIVPKFYHYAHAIERRFAGYGAKVSFFYDRDISIIHTIVSNFYHKGIKKLQEIHYKKILKKIKEEKFDYLITIKGYMMQDWFIAAVKRNNPGIKTVLYQWDSIKFQGSDYRYLIPHFDKTLSFDIEDSQSLNLPYLPTFSLFEPDSAPKDNFKYDLIFCANYTDEKYKFAVKLLEQVEYNNLKAFIYIYLNPIKYWIKRLKRQELDSRVLGFKRLNKEEYHKLFVDSKVVVDFSNSFQTGFSMRIVDAWVCGKKIMTNNKNISSQIDYLPEQIIAFDDKTFNLSEIDIQPPYYFKPKAYFIDDWMEKLLFTEK